VRAGKELLWVLVEEIWAAARKEAEEILNSAQRKAEEIIAEAGRRARESQARKLEEARLRVRQKLSRELALKKLQIKHEYIIKKNKIVEDLIREAEAKVYEVIKSGKSEYVSSLKSLALEAIMSLGSRDIVLYACNERDKALLATILDEILAEAKKRGRDVRAAISDATLGCAGGLLAVSKDKREYFNNTIEARIRRVREEYIPNILSKLL